MLSLLPYKPDLTHISNMTEWDSSIILDNPATVQYNEV